MPIITKQIITSIELQKNNKRVNIYLNHKFSFGLDLENFVNLNLKVNQELDEVKIQSIKELSEKQKVLDKVVRFTSIRPRSKKEINDYLKRKKISDVVCDYVFEKLNEFKILDDLQFAKWWVDQRLSFSPKSKRVIQYELKMKGIQREIINEVLGDVEIDELKIAKELIKNKMYRWEKFDTKIKKQKITQYLAGKGFDWNTISDVIK